MEDTAKSHVAPPRTERAPQFGENSASALGLKWSALHEAAATIASIAGIEPEASSSQIRNFPATVRDAGGRRRERAQRGIEDLTAILEPGLKALLEAMARNAAPAPPARVLYEEFLAARNAMLLMVATP